LFAGNGYFGVDLEGDTQLYIKDGRSLSLAIPFNPVVQISVMGYNSKGRGSACVMSVLVEEYYHNVTFPS